MATPACEETPTERDRLTPSRGAPHGHPLTPAHGAPHGHRFTEILHAIRQRAEQGPITIGELLELSGPQGHAFLALFFILPFMQPIPMPGIGTALGLVVAQLGIFATLEKQPWVPARLARISIDAKMVRRLCAALELLLRRLERIVRPRAKDLLEMRWLRRLNGVLWVIHALVLSLPMPIPFSNSLPAVVVLLLILGTMEDDIVVIALAYVGVVVNIAFFAGLIVLPVMGWRALSS